MKIRTVRPSLANITRHQWRPGWRGALLLVLSTLPAMSIAQDTPGAATPQETPTSIARLLAGRQAFAKLTVKGKVKRDIKMDDQTYPMVDGPSRVVLLKLPDYQGPYALTVKSYQYKHAFSVKFGIFVPTTVVLDGDFAVTRTVPETELQWKSASMMKGARLEVMLPFAESQKAERFVLLYTKGRLVGRATRMADMLNVPPNTFIAETTADGSIEAETGPMTNK